ncbi:MAG: enoyl-ACP reductase [Nitrospirota bacterium]|nr:enoyl-ACP reductase [Nitrospirota bacterium]
MGLFENKKAVICGVANERSIAWAIAQHLHREGAELAFTYAGDAFRERVEPLAASLGSKLVLSCDVTKDDEIDAAFERLRDEWGGMDVLVHSLAFANKEELKGRFVDTSREGFMLAMNVSAYSLVALSRRALPLMAGRSGNVLTLSYYGAEKVFPNYNVMGVAKAALESTVQYLAADLGKDGVRVNAISAGPIRTLAAMGIGDFREILNHVQSRSPLNKNVTADEVGKTAVYLCSDLASGVTGEVIHVDAGYHVIGM